MDPVKKTFSESFADFELPVSDELWQQVRQKRRPPARRVPLLYRIAAAAAVAMLLGAAWFLWPESGNESPAPQMAGKNSTIRSGQTEGVIRPARSIQPVAATESPDPQPGSRIPDKPSRTMSSRPSPTVAMDTSPESLTHSVQDEPGRQDGVAWVEHTEDALVQGPDLDFNPDALPIPMEPVIADVPEPVSPRQPGVQLQGMETRRRPLLPASLKPMLRNAEKTGPERLLAALETFRPRVVDDLIALGSRRTEIEISW